MTSRSIVLGTAALLLLTAATPLQLGFAPAAAVAQEASQELRAAMTADPNQLEPRKLSEYIRVLRDAIKSGALSKSDKKAVQQRIKHYQAVLAQHRDQRQQAGQDDQRAEDRQQRAQQAEPAQDQPSERQARQEALKDKLRAERQAEKAARQAERAERKAERQAERQQPQQQAQPRAEDALSPEMIAVLRDTRPASALETAELRNRSQVLRSVERSDALSREQRGQVQARVQADRDALQARRAERNGDVATQQPAPPQATPEQTPEKPPRLARTERMPDAEVEQRARSIIADNRPAAQLDEQALRKRLSDNRAILETSQLSKAEVRELRQQLRQDREELRSRVASRQEQQEETAQRPSSAGGAIDSRNVSRIIEQRMPSDQLTDRELEERVRILSRALNAGNITVREAEVARLLIDRDRRELSNRLHADRDRRRERRRHAQSRDEIIIDFNVGYRPPPVIFAAEAMPREIEMQLVAPPSHRVSRPYSFQEIAANHDIRQTMPGIEIDTLNFDFGSAEVRPEEIDKLDAIAEVIERIVEQRPDEVFLIEGHTDAVGSDAANHALSQRRAHAVVEALLDYYAIYPENLQTVGLGERYLKIWTQEPEEENRRVTIRRITPLLAGGQG